MEIRGYCARSTGKYPSLALHTHAPTVGSNSNFRAVFTIPLEMVFGAVKQDFVVWFNGQKHFAAFYALPFLMNENQSVPEKRTPNPIFVTNEKLKTGIRLA